MIFRTRASTGAQLAFFRRELNPGDIPDIDFTCVRSLGPGGQRDGYEQFICQQVAQDPPTLTRHGFLVNAKISACCTVQVVKSTFEFALY